MKTKEVFDGGARKMMSGKSLNTKFLAALFVVLFIGQSIGSGIGFLYMRSALLESLQKRLRKAAAVTAEVITGPLLNYDYAPVDAYLDRMMKDEDILSVRVLDSEGKVLKEKVRKTDYEVSALNFFLFRKAMSLTVPVVAAGSKVGEIDVGYSARSINGDMSAGLFSISLYEIFMLLAVGVTMLFLFNRNIRKPVSEINGAIEKITAGKLSTRLPDLGDDEIGSIARGISYLVERFSGTVSKLNSTAVNVSMAIKQVDVTYDNVTGSTRKQSDSIKDIIKSINGANRAQSDINDKAEKLSGVSTENVSALIQMKATAEEIAANTQRLFKATEDSYSVVAELAHTAKAISKHSHEALSAVEETSASVEEIGASVREVEEHARASSRMAEKVREVTSENGMLTIVNAVEGMENISAEVNKSSEIVQRLGARSSDIEKVLSVIRDVTEQTNLLSLNAAILAVQAGEHGKSFSVVADEIRALSERTASSTREIGGIVKAIQKDIGDAVHSIDSAKVKVDDGNSLVIKVGDALREILTASEHSTEMAKSIERATEEQSLGLGQITAAIEEIRKMMHSIAKSTSEEDNALSYLLEGVGEVKEVADLSKRGTEEQAVGTRGISKNLELANDVVRGISDAVLHQKELNDNIIGAMENIDTLGIATVKDMEDVSQSLNTLAGEIETLKKEMEVFRTA
ncbi:MAG: HAMP domain-containing methyl-accepting chemotaxis protein [Candidatus Sulfobium sp.]